MNKHRNVVFLFSFFSSVCNAEVLVTKCSFFEQAEGEKVALTIPYTPQNVPQPLQFKSYKNTVVLKSFAGEETIPFISLTEIDGTVTEIHLVQDWKSGNLHYFNIRKGSNTSATSECKTVEGSFNPEHYYTAELEMYLDKKNGSLSIQAINLRDRGNMDPSVMEILFKKAYREIKYLLHHYNEIKSELDRLAGFEEYPFIDDQFIDKELLHQYNAWLELCAHYAHLQTLPEIEAGSFEERDFIDGNFIDKKLLDVSLFTQVDFDATLKILHAKMQKLEKALQGNPNLIGLMNKLHNDFSKLVNSFDQD